MEKTFEVLELITVKDEDQNLLCDQCKMSSQFILIYFIDRLKRIDEFEKNWKEMIERQLNGDFKEGYREQKCAYHTLRAMSLVFGSIEPIIVMLNNLNGGNMHSVAIFCTIVISHKKINDGKAWIGSSEFKSTEEIRKDLLKRKEMEELH